MCCGSGRDTYLAAQLVGPAGKVIGVEPNAERLVIAQKYLDREIKQFGYETCNVKLLHGCPEDLAVLGIADASVDVVISNCTFNLSPHKGAYVAEVKRVLKPQGEWYFTDVFTDRRIPQETSDKIENVALRLGGALFVEDFRRIARHPLTGTALKGFQIPNWDKAIDVVERAARLAYTLPQCRWIGWDLAFLADGDVAIIEGNWRPGTLAQNTHPRGIYHELLKLTDKL